MWNEPPSKFAFSKRNGDSASNVISPAVIDSVASGSIGEELGFVGAMIVLTIFLLIFKRGIDIAKNTTDTFGILLSLGIAISIVMYAFVNIAVVTGIFPVTGLPIPLISHGGSNLVINMCSLGILLNISKTKKGLNAGRNWVAL